MRGPIPRLLVLAAWLLVAVGTLARVVRYAVDRPLWADEATVALAVLERSFGGLWLPQAGDPVTPIGFLLATKAVTLVLGNSELALRLLPLLASLAALPVFYAIARELLEPDEALSALMLFAILEPLIFYASECKQYSTDVLATLLVLWPGVRLLARGPTRATLGFAALAGALGMFFSLTAVFVAFGLVGALGVAHARVGWRPAGVLGAVFIVVFAVVYASVLAPHQENLARAGWWSTFYAPLGVSREALAWYPRTLFGFFNDPMGLPAVGLAAVTFAAGVVAIGLRDRAMAVLLLAPIALALAASAFELMPFATSEQYGLADGYYPFFGRVLLYAVPLAVLVLAAGLGSWLRLAGRDFAYVGGIGAGLLLAVPLFVLFRNLWNPPVIQDMRALSEQMRPRVEESDLLFTLGYADPVVEYYALRDGLPGVTAVLRARTEAQLPPLLARFEAIPSGTRFWFATVHHPHWPTRQEREVLLPVFDRYADPLAAFESYNGNARLYRRR